MSGFFIGEKHQFSGSFVGSWFWELGTQPRRSETCRMADPVQLFILGKGASTHPTLEMRAQWRGGGAEGGDTEEVVPSREGRSHSHRGTPPDSTRGRPCSFRGVETLPLPTLPPRNQTLVEMACRLSSGEGPLRAAPGGNTWVGGVVRLQAVPPCQSPELWGWNALQKLSPAEARRLGLSHPCIAQGRVWAGQGAAPGGGSAAHSPDSWGWRASV